MLAAVFSDTHSNTALMLEAVRRWRPELLIHLGDHERDSQELLREFPELPLYCVRGNCDLFSLAPDWDTVPLGPVTAFITHGHNYGVESGRLDKLVYAAQEQGASLAMFGHTHRALCSQLDGVTLLNPGTAGKGLELSFALVRVSPEGELACEIKPL